jgi:hypothetical protein
MPLAGMTNCNAAFTAMYSTATVATPNARAIGRLRRGSRISPETVVTRFQPS